MRLYLALFFTLVALRLHAEPQIWRVGSKGADYSGATEEPIIKAVAAAQKAGGGTVIIQEGTYQLQRGIRFDGVKGVTLRGEGKVVLQLRPARISQLQKAGAVGDDTLLLQDSLQIPAGLHLRVLAPGETNSFTGKPTPHFSVTTLSVDGRTLKLRTPLVYPAEAGVRIWDENEPNVLEFAGACERIVIENLTLEGGLQAASIQQATHNTRCGVMIEGRYDYAKGPIGPKPKEITIRDCRIQNFHGRGVAIYSADQIVVENCQIENTLDEGLDLDHFANGCTLRNNSVRRATVGVEMNDANDSRVENNRCEEVDAGIRIWRWCKQEELNVRNEVRNNRLAGIRRVALEFQSGTANNLIEGNRLTLAPGSDIRREKWFRDAGKDNRWVDNLIEVSEPKKP